LNIQGPDNAGASGRKIADRSAKATMLRFSIRAQAKSKAKATNLQAVWLIQQQLPTS
jgi:hypothetical protein